MLELNVIMTLLCFLSASYMCGLRFCMKLLWLQLFMVVCHRANESDLEILNLLESTL
jgi:hypothetical protein